MKLNALILVLVLSVFAAGSYGAVEACKSAGPNKHIGSITAIDAKAGTFSIRDAETDHEMTFTAAGKIIKGLKLNDRVMVGFKEEDGRMIAVDVHS
ncbi:MAG TPA: hypothetical protein VI702_06785 [Nitrospiria bacterium]